MGEARDEFGGREVFDKALKVLTDSFEAVKYVKTGRNESSEEPDHATRFNAVKLWFALAIPETAQSISTTEVETESDNKGKGNDAVKLPPLTPDLERRILQDRLDALNALPAPK